MNPLSFPKITPPAEWEVPANIEVRRVLNDAGIMCLVFSDPSVIATGTQRGWVGTVEDLFRPANLPLIYSSIQSPKR